MLGAKISAFSLDIPSTPAHYNELKIKYIADERINLIDSNKVFKFISDAKPDYLFHLAAQPLVLESYRNQYNTYMSNTMGTLNILEGLKRYNNKCAAVIITSDKCYENLDNIIDYTEDNIVGSEYVRSYGGKIIRAKLLNGVSTTNTINLIKDD